MVSIQLVSFLEIFVRDTYVVSLHNLTKWYFIRGETVVATDDFVRKGLSFNKAKGKTLFL